jgi:hypothetical protein
MYPAIHVGQTDTSKEKKLPTACAHPRPAFSRASHFAAVLIPVVLGVGYAMLIRDVEGSFLFRLGVFSMFLFGLGGAISTLFCVGLVEDWEERHEK